METSSNTKRLYILDVLRGFAITSIMLLHNIGNFDNRITPKNLPEWMSNLDNLIWEILVFLFEGKSYAIFSLLFGVTFYIQVNNQERKNLDFRLRFFWRMFLLLCFGIINSIFFQGDILTIYALLGFIIIPFYKVNNKIIVFLSFILIIRPLEIYYLYESITYPDSIRPKFHEYFGNTKRFINSESFWEVAKGNILYGKLGSLYWLWRERISHIFALFLLGLLAGRKQIFEKSHKNKNFWKKSLLLSILFFIPLYILKSRVYLWIDDKAIHDSIYIIVSSWCNILFTSILLSSFVLLSYENNFEKLISIFSPIGKMSLSNYVFQSVIGALIYYEFGLGMNKYTGNTYSLCIGIILSIICWYFCKWWLGNHKRGPLEALWHKLTWIDKSKSRN